MKLGKLTINHGGKINADITGPVVVDFGKSKLIAATGDQEEGKTKLEETILYALAKIGGKELIAAITNNESGLIDVQYPFVGNDGFKYEVIVKNEKFTVIREGESKGSGAPKELLNDVLGPVIHFPGALQKSGVFSIIKFLADTAGADAASLEKKLAKNKADTTTAKNGRAAANKSAKGLREYLAGEGLLDKDGEIIEKVYTAKETKYKKPVDVQAISKELDAAGKKTDKLVEHQTLLKQLNERKEKVDQQIADLLKEQKELEVRIEKGQKLVEDNKGAQKEYDDIRKRYDNVAAEATEYQKWVDAKAKIKEMQEFQEVAQGFDAKEKELIAKKQEMFWEILPDVKDTEIVLDDEYEDGELVKKADFYYKGLGAMQMSFSQFLGVMVQHIKKSKPSIMIIDDASTLGSKFMAELEKLVKAGCYVLITEMVRGQQKLEIEYR